MYKKFFCYCVAINTMLSLHTMERKEKHDSLAAKSLLQILKEKYSFKKMTLDIQIDFDEAIKKKGGLHDVWNLAIGQIMISPKLHAIDSKIIVLLECTKAHRNLKKFYKLQLKEKTLRRIKNGRETGYVYLGHNQKQPKKRTYCTSVWYSLALVSTGWFSKVWWDNGGSKLIKSSALLLVNTLKSVL